MPAPAWRELWRSDDLIEARAVGTTILAMEYETRLLAGDGRELEPGGDQDGPYRVHVREDDFFELTDVVDEIAAEQTEFDEHVESWQGLSCRVRRGLLIVMIVIVMVLAIIGAIEI